jgi:hypothetical protein
MKITLPDLARHLSEQIKHENEVIRDDLAGLRDSVGFLSRKFDHGLAKVQEDMATASVTSVSVLRKNYAEAHAGIFQELQVTRSGVSELGETVRRVELSLGALLTKEDLGRVISKPGQLRELCDIVETTPGFTASKHSTYSPRVNLALRTCVCRKRVIRSRQALLWGPWQAFSQTSTTHDHFPDCIYHSPGATISSARWAVAFRGLQRLLGRAVEVSFSYSFGAGGCSLSPGLTYYPTIDRRRDPAFRIMGLISWACERVDGREPGLGDFFEQCMENMALLYRRGKASPRAVDLYGRGVLHYFDRGSVVGLRYFDAEELFTNKSQRSMSRGTLLGGLDTLVKLGVQTTIYDVYGSCASISLMIQFAQLTSLQDTCLEHNVPDGASLDMGHVRERFRCETRPSCELGHELSSE